MMPLTLPLSVMLTVLQSPIRFADVTEAAGIDIVNRSGESSKDYIVEINGNGAAFFDYDEDGDVDLLVVNGSSLALLPSGGSPIAALYRNLGDGRFDDVTASSGLTARGWGMGVCVADVDNDGAKDVYLTAYGPNRLFRNHGDGTFEDVSSRYGVDDDRYGTGCSFGDHDRDGLADLYVANYVQFDLEEASRGRGSAPTCQFMGISVSCGPRHFAAQPDLLYRNGGDGTFDERSGPAGTASESSYGFGVVSTDIDDDGWLDIYVANDSRPNFFFHNDGDGDGSFTEMGLALGVALSEEGRTEAGMGVDVADYDNDGFLDVFVTNFSHETNTLYRGGREGIFSDVSFLVGLGGPSLAYLGWGTGLVDLNNDGWLDVFVANGHIFPEVDTSPLGTSFAQRNLLFESDGAGRFRDVTSEAGAALRAVSSSRGVAFGDFDDDGKLDLFVVNLDETGNLLRNESESTNHWLGLRLIGTASNRDAIGARVELVASQMTRVAEVRSGGSFLSHNDVRLHFGLGSHETVDRIDVRWPSGEVESLQSIPADTSITVVERRSVLR